MTKRWQPQPGNAMAVQHTVTTVDEDGPLWDGCGDMLSWSEDGTTIAPWRSAEWVAAVEALIEVCRDNDESDEWDAVERILPAIRDALAAVDVATPDPA